MKVIQHITIHDLDGLKVWRSPNMNGGIERAWVMGHTGGCYFGAFGVPYECELGDSAMHSVKLTEKQTKEVERYAAERWDQYWTCKITSDFETKEAKKGRGLAWGWVNWKPRGR